MTTINKQHGFYGALAAHYASPDHRNAIWDITVKRLGQIHPEKSADEILDFLNGRGGRITPVQRHAQSWWTSACCTGPQSGTKCATAASANWWTVR